MKSRFTYAIVIMLLHCITVMAQEKSFVTSQVTVSGLVDSSFVITLDNITNFQVQEINKDQDVTCASGEVKKEIHSFKGVLLREIIDTAGVTMPHKKARGEYFIYITASDGYKVIFAWNELYYGAAGENTWLLYEENGKPILEDGKFIILCASDIVTGPRHVKWVEKIELIRTEN